MPSGSAPLASALQLLVPELHVHVVPMCPDGSTPRFDVQIGLPNRLSVKTTCPCTGSSPTKSKFAPLYGLWFLSRMVAVKVTAVGLVTPGLNAATDCPAALL